MMVNLIASASIWGGAFVGILKIIDWLLSVEQKKSIQDWSLRTWVWLDDQRMGKLLIASVKGTRTQQVSSIISHMVIFSTYLIPFLAVAALNLNPNIIPKSLHLGFPFVYHFQLWVEVAALLVSIVLVTRTIHPYLMSWLTDAKSLPRYFGRVFSALFVCGLLHFLPGEIWSIYVPSLAEDGWFVLPASIPIGKPGIVIFHAITATLNTPVVVEMFFLNFLLAISLDWLILIWLLIILHSIANFIALRLAEHKEGPVLGLSALLVAIGAITKAFAM
jgi:hypothetical protein